MMFIKIGAMLAAAAMVLVGTAAAAQQATANPTAQAEEGKLSPNWIHASVPNGFTLVAAEDLIITEAISPMMKRKSPDLIQLLQSADVTFGNYEDTAIALRKFGGHPDALTGGGWLISSPRVSQDLKPMGFNLVGRANNHTTDWGVAGTRYTNDLLDKADIVHAGTGNTLAEARAPQKAM